MYEKVRIVQNVAIVFIIKDRKNPVARIDHSWTPCISSIRLIPLDRVTTLTLVYCAICFHV